MSVEENKALSRRWVEAVNAENPAALDDVLAADFQFYNTSSPALHTRDDYKQLTTALRTSFPPGQWIIEEMVAEGDKVAFWMTFRGVHSAPWRGVAPTGKEVAMSLACIARCAGGMVVEAKQVPDSLGLLVKIGAVSVPAQPTK